jgi:hypothetical protein
MINVHWVTPHALRTGENSPPFVIRLELADNKAKWLEDLKARTKERIEKRQMGAETQA